MALRQPNGWATVRRQEGVEATSGGGGAGGRKGEAEGRAQQRRAAEGERNGLRGGTVGLRVLPAAQASCRISGIDSGDGGCTQPAAERGWGVRGEVGSVFTVWLHCERRRGLYSACGVACWGGRDKVSHSLGLSQAEGCQRLAWGV